LTVALTDEAGNAALNVVGEVRLEADPPLSGWPRAVQLQPDDRGSSSLTFTAPDDGLVSVVGSTADGIEGESNPLVVSEGARILWADLHGHSGISDGTGTPEDFLFYAREVAALDVVALTDHDHWGVQPLATHPEIWQRIRRETKAHNEPGRFVALLGFEWTNWILGHRHVLYFGNEGEVLSSVDRRFEHPRQLWDALRGKPALTFAHHSAGGPVATDWSIPPDPELEPVTEIVSVHGSSEALDSPFPIYRPLGGNFVRDVLNRGHRLGFVGSGDGHDGHPGLTHLSSPQMGGLAAILSEELTPEAILEALRARRVYATNGPRIVLRATLDGNPMGSVMSAAESSDLGLYIAAGESLETVEVVRSGRPEQVPACGGRLDCSTRIRLEGLASGEYVYVRAVQKDGGAVWSSPFFIE
jgi:hypothetical protein